MRESLRPYTFGTSPVYAPDLTVMYLKVLTMFIKSIYCGLF